MNKILKGVVVSEKSAQLLKQNKYVFFVTPHSNKIVIRQAVEQLYNVSVIGVNITKNKGKTVRRGRITGKKSTKIKAVVSLAEGDAIDSYKELF